jgi:glycosyltransferase involved in cell wall biosynthesis
MKFAIITHVPHILTEDRYYAYAPYVREMNVWSKYVSELIVVAPQVAESISSIDASYEHDRIQFVSIDSFDVLDFKNIFLSVLKIPSICWHIFLAMRSADHIHLRCPGNVGLLGCFIQILFPKTPKTAKYAGNWDSKSKQPWTYQLQRWLLGTTFLTRNMQVLVYGEWEGRSENIKPFFTATYTEADKTPLLRLDSLTTNHFIFVGALVSGKNPLYAIQLVERLCQQGVSVYLDLYGEGSERFALETYIKKNQLESYVHLKGNQPLETIKTAYQNSHFVVLPSASEGWPKVVAEGMFWGCIPIATPVSCVSFMLDYGQRGVLLTLDLETDVAQIMTVIKNNVGFKNMRIKASDWSRTYTLDVFEVAIKELLSQDKSR